MEPEPDESGRSVRVATLLLTNRECPWKCVFCDLWTNTLDETVPRGAIPEQIRGALANLSPARWIKLYNAGSFFDPHAIPPEDFPAIADLLAPFERVIVESHPALIDDREASRVLRFRDLLRAVPLALADSAEPSRSIRETSPSGAARSSQVSARPDVPATSGSPALPLPSRVAPRGQTSPSPATRPTRRLEVAMGLETVHPFALERLNKGMTLDDFSRAADVLRNADIDLRAFVLVQPPYTPPDEAVSWAVRSVEFARDRGARFVALIPTRGGNGAMEALRDSGEFVPPRLATLEEAFDRALELVSARATPIVAADLWDLARFSDCAACFPAREARLRRMNLSQQVEPRVPCDCSSDAVRRVGSLREP